MPGCSGRPARSAGGEAVELEPAFAQGLSTQLEPMFVMREEEYLRASGQGGELRQNRSVRGLKG